MLDPACITTASLVKLGNPISSSMAARTRSVLTRSAAGAEPARLSG
jgi:hypothetical protein